MLRVYVRNHRLHQFEFRYVKSIEELKSGDEWKYLTLLDIKVLKNIDDELKEEQNNERL